VISEVHYRPASPSSAEIAAGFGDRGEFEFLELLNIGASPVNLTGLSFTAGIDFDFAAHSSIAALDPGQRILIVENAAAFAMRYGAGFPVGGEFQNGSQLANDGERLTLVNGAVAEPGRIVQSFSYGDAPPWPQSPDGSGFSLTLACAAANPDPSLPASWRASVAVGGSPGGDDSLALSDWLASHGLSAGDELRDDDRDLLPVLLEYALGGSPSVGESALRPVVGMRVQNHGGSPARYAVMSFQRSKAADGVITIPEASTDLINWHPVTGVIESGPSGQAGIDVVTVALELPASGKSQQFLRLRVEAK
jgi:hypothetical protein